MVLAEDGGVTREIFLSALLCRRLQVETSDSIQREDFSQQSVFNVALWLAAFLVFVHLG